MNRASRSPHAVGCRAPQGRYELARTPPVALNRGVAHPSHSVPNTAISGVASATPYSIHTSPRRRYLFEAGCNAESQKRRLYWARGIGEIW